MKTLKTLVMATAVSAGLLGTSGAMAANQGKLSDLFSIGDFEIKYLVDSQVAIWGLRDLSFNKNNIRPEDGISAPQTIKACVASSSGAVQFQVETTEGSFQLFNGDKAGADFTVKITDREKTSALWGKGGLEDMQLATDNFSVTGVDLPVTNNNGDITDVCTSTSQSIDIEVQISNIQPNLEGEYSNIAVLTVTAI